MANRNTIHFSHLDRFKRWLVKDGYELLPLSNNPYEVLRAKKRRGLADTLQAARGEGTLHIHGQELEDGSQISKRGEVMARYKAMDREEYIYTVPTADVVEVVRCKDCKHYQFADNRAFGMPVKMCEWFGFEDVDDDDFCSRAERRTDG